MNMVIFIEPHEHSEAIEAYKDRLTKAQIDLIHEAEDTALVLLDIRNGKTEVMIIEEGGEQ